MGPHFCGEFDLPSWSNRKIIRKRASNQLGLVQEYTHENIHIHATCDFDFFYPLSHFHDTNQIL